MKKTHVRMERTHVRAEFCIYGDSFDPSDVTERLGIQPETTHLKGDSIRMTPLKRKETSWEIGTEYEETFDINDVLIKVVTPLQGKEDILKQIRELYDVTLQFMIVICVRKDQLPGMYLPRETVEFAGTIGAVVAFDVYVR